MSYLKRTISVLLAAVMLAAFVPAGALAQGFASGSGAAVPAEQPQAEPDGMYYLQDDEPMPTPAPRKSAARKEIDEPLPSKNESDYAGGEPTRTVYSGTCGDNLTWTLDTETGLLEISGTGPMWDIDRPLLWGCELSSEDVISVSIADGVTSIGNHAFEYLNITSLTIPDSVTRIGNYSFYYCMELAYVNLGNGVTSIGSYAFSGCRSIENIFLSNNLKNIGDHSFENTRIGGILLLPDSVTTIGDYSFYESDIWIDSLPKNLQKIGAYAFAAGDYWYQYLPATIPEGVTYIGDGAFAGHRYAVAHFLGAPPLYFGSDVFQGCASCFRIRYKQNYISEWSPHGENIWHGYKTLLLADVFYIVKFKLNYGNNDDWFQVEINPNEYTYSPDAPSRNGYVFAGWYLNPECAGDMWFNSKNNYKGERINSALTLYAKWISTVDMLNQMSLTTDYFSFRNNKNCFTDNSLFDKYKNLISGEYLIALENQYSNNKSILQSRLEEEWNGACYGMSCVAALIKAGRLSPEFFQEGASCTYDFNQPNHNNAVRNLIEYYQLIPNSSAKSYENYYENDSWETEPEYCRRLINTITSSPYPVIINFITYRMDPDGKKPVMTHAVLACGCTLTDSKYIINIFDPNEEEIVHLFISSVNFANLGFDCQKYDDKNRTVYRSLIFRFDPVENNTYDIQNIQDYLIGAGYDNGSEARIPFDEEKTDTSCERLVLNTNYGTFCVEDSNGEVSTLESGILTEGTIVISNGNCTNDYGYELSLDYSISALEERESYTIMPAECNSSISDEPLGNYSTSLLYSNGEDSFYSKVDTAGNIPVTISYDGSITTNSDTPIIQSATVTRDDMTSNWFAVEVDSEATTSLNVVPSSDEVVIRAADNASYNITVRSFFNEITFENINGGEAGVTVIEDEDGNTKIIYNETEEVAAEDVFGYSLVFCTMGADAIDTQSGIPMGGTAVQPADPVRTGLIFGGWYTTYECEDGTEWSFDTPITEDTFIYAKWIVNDDYMHLVTFRIEGCDDVSYLVVDGEALTDYVLPEIPEREGYTAEWPKVDLSCVTEDIVIEPVYTSIITLGDANLDGILSFADVAELYNLIFAGGVFTAEQLAVCDVNGDGAVSFADIAALYSTVLGSAA